MTVSFRPYYLPREFTELTVILAYVPGPDNALTAERIADSYNSAVTRAADQPVFLLGDFNSCDVTTLLPQLEQYVTTPTRQDRRLDLCFGNIPGAYVSKSVEMLRGCYELTRAKAERQYPNPASFVEELNTSYARLNMSDTIDWTPASTNYTSAPVSMEERKVVSVHSRLHPRKALGPDGLKGCILRECAAQLGHVVAQLFQLLLAASFVLHAWKRTVIIPLPKKPQPKP